MSDLVKASEAIELLAAASSKENIEMQRRFGVKTETIGVRIPDIRAISKKMGKDHTIALQLWDSKIHEARILASMVDDPKLVTEQQMEKWVKDIKSWDLCDSCCGNLFDKTRFAYKKVSEWSNREDEYVKRAGFALIAYLAVHDKKAEDNKFSALLPIIERECEDDRVYVKKAVNWALRQIGKRNLKLNAAAIASSKRIQKRNSRSAKWIASDALRELTSDAVIGRLNG